MQATAATQDRYITGTAAKRLTGAGWNKLYKAALLGQVRIRALPGQDVLYHEGDVLRLKAEPAEAIGA